jgi:MYXO-CTERM domain-containing protein
MRRSGSTCERKWPTEGGPRIRLAVIAGLLLAMQGTARAEWQVHGLDGGAPTDVEVWGPELYSVSTPQAAWRMSTDGGILETIPSGASSSVGTVYYPATNCFVSFLSDGKMESRPAGCASAPNILPDTPNPVYRVKHTADAGAAYAWGASGSEPQFVYSERGAYGPAPWAPLPPPPMTSGSNRALGVLSQNNVNHALFGLIQGNFVWYQGNQLQGAFRVPAPHSAGTPQGIDLFPGDGGPTALLGLSTGLLRAPLIAGGVIASEVSLPGGQGSVTSVDVNTGVGGPNGDGFGMALLSRNGETVVLQAVPATSPDEIGKVWKVNPLQPVLSAPPGQVKCRGAQVCVLTVNRPDRQNIAIYRNFHRPVIGGDPETAIPEDSSLSVFVGVKDDDGDPLRVTVLPPDGGMPPDGGLPPLRISTSEQDGGVLFQLTAAPVCEDTLVPVRLVASDGLRTDDKILNFRVVHERPDAPTLDLKSNRLTVQAGGDAGIISVIERPGAARCRIDRYHWSGLSPNAERLETNGGVAVFPVPTVLCEQNGRSYFYRVQAIDEGGTLSAPTDFNVQVRPWGVPNAPFDADAGVGIDAGQTRTLSPKEDEHACRLAPGYPGVDTLWELTEGTLPLEGVELTTQDGGLVTGPRAVTPQLILRTQECADAQLTFSVRHIPRDGSGLEGPASTFRVRVDPRWVRPSTGTLTLDVDEEKLSARAVVGESIVQNVNCLAQRGGVKARLRLERADGTVVRQGEFTAPGPWGFLLDEACAPATTYNVVGELLDVSGSGGEGSLSAQALTQISVEVPSAAPALEELYEPRITARCGEAASGTLQQRLPSGPCQGLSLVWEQLSGPPLTQTTYAGQRIEVVTQGTDFGELIGQPVKLQVTASEVGLRKEHTVPISAEPFVEVNRRTERSTGADTDLLGVSVELHNTTECGVREVSHVERLEGVDYVPGSARFNGAPVEAEVTDSEPTGSELTVRGIVLEGDGRGLLTYVVRPRLLEPQRFGGQSSLRGVAISQPPEAPASGCGCSGGGSGAAAMGLMGLLAVLSRRRRR